MADPASLWPGYGIPAEQTPARSAEMRNALEALARTFFSTDPLLPTNPRDGQLRVFDEVGLGNTKLQWRVGGAWTTMLQNIQDGVAAPAKQVAAGFAAVPSTPWVVDHNLGSKPLPQIYDLSFRQLQPVHTFQKEYISFGRVDLATLLAGVLLVMPARFEGRILEVYAATNEGIPGVAAASLQWEIDSTPSGGGVVPLTGGLVTIPAGPHTQGTQFPGSPVTATNVFSQHLDLGAGMEDILRVFVPAPPTLAAGSVELFAVVERGLHAGQYQLQHVNDNRFTVDFAAPQAGFVVLVG